MTPMQPAPRPAVPPFYFNGGAATYFGTGILATLITICTFGIMTPFAVVLRQRWRAKHTYIEGRRLMFTGTGMGLFGQWLKWLCLIVITAGIYTLWVVPRLTKWVVENTEFDPTHLPAPQPPPSELVGHHPVVAAPQTWEHQRHPQGW